MAKSHAQRQKGYLKRLKEKGEADYLKRDREQKQKERAALKLNKNMHQSKQGTDRKKLKKQVILEQSMEPTASSPTLFGSIQSFGKASAKAKHSLPKSPKKKRAVITFLVKSLSPNSKKQVYESGRRTVDVNLGRQKIPVKTKELLIGFLERPNISYCKPGRGDTVYCGKNEIYKCKNYLLWTFKELVELYNSDRDDGSDEISYYF